MWPLVMVAVKIWWIINWIQIWDTDRSAARPVASDKTKQTKKKLQLLWLVTSARIRSCLCSNCTPPGGGTLGHIKVSHLSLQTTSGFGLADRVPACAHYVCVHKHIKPSLSEPVHCIALYQIHCSRRPFDPRSLGEPFIQLGIIPNTLWPGPLQDSLQQSERERFSGCPGSVRGEQTIQSLGPSCHCYRRSGWKTIVWWEADWQMQSKWWMDVALWRRQGLEYKVIVTNSSCI